MNQIDNHSRAYIWARNLSRKRISSSRVYSSFGLAAFWAALGLFTQTGVYWGAAVLSCVYGWIQFERLGFLELLDEAQTHSPNAKSDDA